MNEKKHDHSTSIVVRDNRHLSTSRSKLITRGLKIAESLEKMPLTIVRDIIVDICENGHLKRWAIIDPVRIKGERIRKIYLGYVFNEKNFSPQRMERYDIRIGDTITIDNFFDGPIRLKVVKEKRTGNEKKFEMPVKCPACDSKIETLEPDSAYYCTDSACPGKIRAQLMVFSDLMHIDLNPELAKELVDKRMIMDAADLYFLKKDDLLRLSQMDEDSALLVLDSIEKSRQPNMTNLIIALLETIGVPFHKGIEVACNCNSIDDLFDGRLLSRIKSPWIKPNDIIEISNKIRSAKTIRFLVKLKRGGVVFPRKKDK